ncbi:thioredoxin family protein [Methylobacterium iners]|uniref:Chaperedoxin n=1 Tax=Methylobacterium iners TaxID=418707 RepID=A0ABQ4S6F6_9HYPH|nr:co-chaperone YbbN [Methylobacterium iners]GJD97260.1 Chaperedoxin [Methylobacterium iners]
MLNDALTAAGPQAGGPSTLIKDVTTASFRQDVIAESMNRPVMVDFWAPWCGPCKQLTPLLEKVVQGAGGRVALAKVNIDESPAIWSQISQQLGLQSIPAVIVIDKGRPVDGFVGALPEGEIKAFVARLVGPGGPSPVEEMMAEAEAALAEGDAAGASELYAAVLAQESTHLGAIAGLAKIQLDLGELGNARQILEMAPPDKTGDPALTSLHAAIELAEKAAALGDLGGLQARIDADPADLQARFDLALGLNGRNERDAAVDQLIEIHRQDKEWNEGAARKQLLTFFEAWGLMDKASIRGRRRLSTLVFA